MFFSKPKNTAPENGEAGTETSAPADKRPVYIIGENALACYLASKFQLAGERTIIVAGKAANTSLATNGITFRENRSLYKSNLKFSTSFWINEEPKLIVIASHTNKINADIAKISTRKIYDTPIICYTALYDFSILPAFLGNNIFRGTFEGSLNFDNQQLNVLGKVPETRLAIEEDNEYLPLIKQTYAATGIPLQTEVDGKKLFWSQFSGDAAISLFSAAFNKTPFEIAKNKELREQIRPLINEICAIAGFEEQTISPDEILKKIYNLPSGFIPPLQLEIGHGRPGEIDSLSSVLLDIARQNQYATPEINKILTKLYNIILA